MLLASVRDTIARHRMLKPGQTVLVAVSGGPDSLALLDVLLQLAPELELRLAVAHLDHGLRPDSAADADFVAAFAAERGLTCYRERVDVAALLRGSGQSPEAVARAVRYAFFERAAAATGAERVALGHNADDQAETIIMRLLRGAGSEGLSGIPPVRLPYVRPLIETPRSEIEAYCRARGLAARRDSTNADPAYTRNRIRHELMPVLKGYNPRLVPALGELGERLRAEADYIARQAADALAACSVGDALACRRLIALPIALQRAALRAYYARATGAEPLAHLHVERLRELAAATAPTQHQLPGGFFARSEGGRLIIKRSEAAPAPFELVPLVPGLTPLPTGETLAAWLTEAGAHDWSAVNARRQAFLDFEACGEFVVRNRRPGDRIRLPGVAGDKKLQDVLVDAKLPRGERDRLPLLARGREILWIPGLRVSERVKVTPATRVVLALQLLSESQDYCSSRGNMLE